MIKAPEEGGFISETGLWVVFAQQQSAYGNGAAVRRVTRGILPTASTAVCIRCFKALAETIPTANPDSRSSPVMG